MRTTGNERTRKCGRNVWIRESVLVLNRRYLTNRLEFRVQKPVVTKALCSSIPFTWCRRWSFRVSRCTVHTLSLTRAAVSHSASRQHGRTDHPSPTSRADCRPTARSLLTWPTGGASGRPRPAHTDRRPVEAQRRRQGAGQGRPVEPSTESNTELSQVLSRLCPESPSVSAACDAPE